MLIMFFIDKFTLIDSLNDVENLPIGLYYYNPGFKNNCIKDKVSFLVESVLREEKIPAGYKSGKLLSGVNYSQFFVSREERDKAYENYVNPIVYRGGGLFAYGIRVRGFDCNIAELTAIANVAYCYLNELNFKNLADHYVKQQYFKTVCWSENNLIFYRVGSQEAIYFKDYDEVKGFYKYLINACFKNVENFKIKNYGLVVVK